MVNVDGSRAVYRFNTIYGLMSAYMNRLSSLANQHERKQAMGIG